MKALVCFSTIVALSLCLPATANESPLSDHAPADQILLISSRGYPTVIGRTFNFETTTARELDARGQQLNRLSLLTPLPPRETWVFVHGNQISPCDAIRRGLRVYRRLRSCACCEGPVRFVIWSWPSERDSCRPKDAQEKAMRTDVESFLLSKVLAKFARNSPVSVIGYSFGSRIVSGALHLASGGNLRGYCTSDAMQAAHPMRVVHIAAASEHDGYQPCCGRYRHALDEVASLTLLNNARDPALNFFWIINKSRPKAIGADGIKGFPAHVQVKQTNWARSVGRDHSLWEYIDRPAALRRIVDGISHPPLEARPQG